MLAMGRLASRGVAVSLPNVDLLVTRASRTGGIVSCNRRPTPFDSPSSQHKGAGPHRPLAPCEISSPAGINSVKTRA